MGCPFWGILAPTKSFYFLQVNSLTSARTEAKLFSSYKALKVGGVIQYDSDEQFVITETFPCAIGYFHKWLLYKCFMSLYKQILNS